MLYINGNLISTSNRLATYEYSAIVEDYHKTIKEKLDYYGEYIVIETKVRPRTDDKTGYMRFPGSRGLLLVSNVNMPNGDGTYSTTELRYSPTILQLDDKGNLKHEDPNKVILRGSLSIDIKRNPDLVYYAMKSGYVGLTPAEGKKFHVYDIKVTDDNNARKRRAEGRVISIIYDVLSEDNLRIMAKSWGISGVDTMNTESVREALYDKVQAGETQKKRSPGSGARGLAEFAASSEVKEVDKLTALCKDAEDTGKMSYNIEDRRWIIDYKDGGQPYILKELSGNEFGNPLASLVNYLSIDANALRKVKNVMGAPVITPEVDEPVVVPRMDAPLYTVEQVMAVGNVPRLKKMLKEVAPDIALKPTARGDEVRQLLLQRLGAASLQETQE